VGWRMKKIFCSASLSGEKTNDQIIRTIVKIVGIVGLNQTEKDKKMMKKAYVVISSALMALVITVSQAHATAYFTLPAEFETDVTLTLTAIAGSILVLLGLMFAWRKTVKSVNRS